MAHLLHNLIGRTGRTGRLSASALAVVLVVSASACVMSPPIEPRANTNVSPRIDPQVPWDRPVIEVTREELAKANGQIELSAALYDGDHEPELRYLFLSDISGNPTAARAPFEQKQDPEEGDEYRYQTVKRTVFPCNGDASIPGTEVITLFVSDRGFDSISPDPAEIIPAEGGIMVAYSWTLRYEADICD